MGKYFGTDGFRGEAGIDLTADHAYKVGRFLGWYYNALRACSHRHRQGHPPQLLYVRVQSGRRTDRLRSRRLPAACHYYAQCGLHRSRG